MAEFEHDRAAEMTQEHIRQDMDDLNNDMAGRNVGRIKRFVTAGQSGLETEEDKKEDADLQAYADLILEEQRQERIAALYDRYDEIDKALDKAIAKSEKDLAAAELYRQQVYENGTKMDDGRTVFIDEKTGRFYDENDQILSDEDQVKAREKYNSNDSSFQDKKSATNAYDVEKRKLNHLNSQKEQLEKSREDFENGDISEDEFKSALDDLEKDDDLKPFLENKTASNNKPENSPSTSVAKAHDSESGIKTDVKLAAAFRNAGEMGQPSQEPAPSHDPQENVPRSSPGMAFT